MWFHDLLGWVAAALVFATFCAKRMAPLRLLAILSNIGFIAYAYLDALWPILILHAAMLPINVFRLRQGLRMVADDNAQLPARKSGAVAPWPSEAPTSS
jgi:hypothetical protein